LSARRPRTYAAMKAIGDTHRLVQVPVRLNLRQLLAISNAKGSETIQAELVWRWVEQVVTERVAELMREAPHVDQPELGLVDRHLEAVEL